MKACRRRLGAARSQANLSTINYHQPSTSTMPESADSVWFYEPVVNLFGRQISPAGITAFVVCLVAGLVVSSFLQSGFMRRQLSRFGLDKGFVAILTASISLVAFLGFLVLGLNLGGLAIPWDSKVPGLGLSLIQIFQLIALIAVVFWFASAAKRFLFNRFLSKSGLDRSLQYTIAQICGYLVLTIGILVALQSAGLNLSALAVFAGAVGVGIGFGLQNITRNFISGLVVLAERPIKIGDRVEVGAVTGQVKGIRARSTTILTNDNITIIVPNSDFIEKPVINWSHGDPRVRFRIRVGISVDSDVPKACRILTEIAQAHPAALKDPEPWVVFDKFGDSTFELELVVWSLEMSYRPRAFRSALNFEIERRFREEGIGWPRSRRDVRLTVPERLRNERSEDDEAEGRDERKET
jgi:small-conductance mechanosensitive channel